MTRCQYELTGFCLLRAFLQNINCFEDFQKNSSVCLKNHIISSKYGKYFFIPEKKLKISFKNSDFEHLAHLWDQFLTKSESTYFVLQFNVNLTDFDILYNQLSVSGYDEWTESLILKVLNMLYYTIS